MASTSPSPAPSAAPSAAPAPGTPAAGQRGILGWLLDLFSNVRFGIVLLAILFVYMSVGSAGVLYPTAPNIFDASVWRHEQIRQRPFFDMTEFEWFHWWPFDLLMVLIALNITVTTLRRIRFKPVNYGVWAIHTGILVMMLGCWIYFGTKVEGDALVVRREVVAEVLGTGPDGKPAVLDTVRFLATPGKRATVGAGPDAYELEVTQIDPWWEMRSGEADGEKAYSVTVQVRPLRGGDSQPFLRQVIAEHPEHTEDLLFTTGAEAHSQPFQRAIKATGKPLVDERLAVRLDYGPTDWFYLRPDLNKSWAMYVRAPGEREWHERPIPGLPLYYDAIGSRDKVFLDAGAETLPLRPIDIEVPAASKDDPFADVPLRVSGYLRYAIDRTRVGPGPPNAALNPVARLLVTSEQDGQVTGRQTYQLEAFDPRARSAEQGIVQFRWVGSEEAFTKLLRAPALTAKATVAGKVAERRDTISALSAGGPDVRTPIGDSGYSFRIVSVQDDIVIGGVSASVAVVEITTPAGTTVRRWVFDDPAMTRDVTEELLRDGHSAVALIDPAVDIRYDTGHGASLVLLVAGPEPERLRLITALGDADARVTELKEDEIVRLPGGIALSVADYWPRAVKETRPFVVPPSGRDRDTGVQLAHALVEAPGNASEWLRYHHFVFPDGEDVPRRHFFEPTTFRLADGRAMEVLFSRQRQALPAEIALERFILTAHVGGYTGESGSIRDYTSELRFRQEGGGWSEPIPVSVNRPVTYGGLSYFQSQWDPPDPARFEGDRGSLGLNYTVLGVGNRHGVWTMLGGTILAVMGMIYAFYFKPVLKRRQREAALALAAVKGPSARPVAELVPVGAASVGGTQIPSQIPSQIASQIKEAT